MFGYTPEELFEFAKKYAPILKFDRREDLREEEFFPINVEAWLSHVATFEKTDCPQWGTSLWFYPPFVGNCPEVNPGELLLTPGGPSGISDRNFVGNSEYHANSNYLLNFGGWADAGHVRGNRDYLFSVFDAIRPIAGNSPVTPSPAPVFKDDFTPQLTCYCEVAMGNHLVELAFLSSDHEEGEPYDPMNFMKATAQAHFQNYLVLTYNYFYPAMQPFRPYQKSMEGQWESISVFILNEKPEFVAYSQGYRPNDNGWWIPQAVAESWSFTRLQKEGDHPIAYVAWGTHANHFDPRISENPIDNSEPSYGESAGQDLIMIGASIGGPWGAAIAAAGIVIELFGLCDDDDESSEGPSYVPESDTRETEHHNGEGPRVELPEPGALPLPPGVLDSSIHLHLIDPTANSTARRDSQPELDESGHPKEPEHPFWWDYTGRWGVGLDLTSENGGWMHGSRRVQYIDTNHPDLAHLGQIGISRAVENMKALLDRTNLWLPRT